MNDNKKDTINCNNIKNLGNHPFQNCKNWGIVHFTVLNRDTTIFTLKQNGTLALENVLPLCKGNPWGSGDTEEAGEAVM